MSDEHTLHNTIRRSQLELQTRLFRNCFDGVDAEQVLERPGGVNHLAFLGVHLIDSRCFFAGYLGVEVDKPFGDLLDNARHLDDIETFPSVEEILRGWEQVTGPISEKLTVLTDEELRAESPQKFPIQDGTKAGGIAFLLHHEAYHLGQMGQLRKMFGLPSMSYA